MKPTPIQMARISLRRRDGERHDGDDSDAAPLTNSSTRPPAETRGGEPEEHLLNAGHQQAAPKKMAAMVIEIPGHATIATPIAMASSPDSSADFQRCGNIVGADGIVMPEVLHSTKSPARISAPFR